MSVKEIQATYGKFPEEAVPEALRLAAAQFEDPVAAA